MTISGVLFPFLLRLSAFLDLKNVTTPYTIVTGNEPILSTTFHVEVAVRDRESDGRTACNA